MPAAPAGRRRPRSPRGPAAGERSVCSRCGRLVAGVGDDAPELARPRADTPRRPGAPGRADMAATGRRDRSYGAAPFRAANARAAVAGSRAPWRPAASGTCTATMSGCGRLLSAGRPAASCPACASRPRNAAASEAVHAVSAPGRTARVASRSWPRARCGVADERVADRLLGDQAAGDVVDARRSRRGHRLRDRASGWSRCRPTQTPRGRLRSARRSRRRETAAARRCSCHAAGILVDERQLKREHVDDRRVESLRPPRRGSPPWPRPGGRARAARASAAGRRRLSPVPGAPRCAPSSTASSRRFRRA